MEINPIAYFRSPLKEKFGAPRQSGIVAGLRGRVEFTPEYRKAEAVKGLDGFGFVWLIWGFQHCEAHLTVRPPRLGGNERVGVFATRSPFRPNGLGLSSVRLVGIDDGALIVEGADLIDGTPIYDVKPYIPFTDSHPEARAGFTDSRLWPRLGVEFAVSRPETMTDSDAADLKALLAEDPRPAYQRREEGRGYGLAFGPWQVRFTVSDGVCRVEKIE